MSQHDRLRWDEKYAARPAPSPVEAGPPRVFAAHAEVFPTTGRALDLACGAGTAAVWLARRGLKVWGLDVSPVAIDQARALAAASGVEDACDFDVVDLDAGLPPGPAVSVVVCHRFRDRRLDAQIIERLEPGGLLAIAVLSEVGGRPGRHRAVRGELAAAFSALHPIAACEGDGEAWLLARR